MMKIQRQITLTVALVLIALGVAACGSNSTPTKAVQTLFNAVKNKDPKAYKSVMSKENLDMMEKAAKEQKTTVDDMLKEVLNKEEMSKMPDKLETQNETIASDGKTATVEVKDEKGKWQKVNLVKEDDGWKIAGGV